MNEQALTAKVLDIYDRYFGYLEEGAAGLRLPDPQYQWRYYVGDVTISRLRKGIQQLDEYWLAQQSYVQTSLKETFDRGPGLDRLPDAALLALFQDLDTLFAEHGLRQGPLPDSDVE